MFPDLFEAFDTRGTVVEGSDKPATVLYTLLFNSQFECLFVFLDFIGKILISHSQFSRYLPVKNITSDNTEVAEIWFPLENPQKKKKKKKKSAKNGEILLQLSYVEVCARKVCLPVDDWFW